MKSKGVEGAGAAPSPSALKKSPKTRLHSPKKTLKNPKTSQDVPPAPPILKVLIVPAEKRAQSLCRELKLPLPQEPIILKQVENESYKPTGATSSSDQPAQRLRPARRSSTAILPPEILDSETEISEEESEEYDKGFDEDDYEEEFLASLSERNKRKKEKKIASKDDVVHCNCANNLDEGFMIQVRYYN